MLHRYRQFHNLHRNRIYLGKNWEEKLLIQDRRLLRGKNKEVIGLMKDELDRKIMTEFVVLKPETCNYLKDNSNQNKRPKHTKSA